jgi:hypothetical protein
VVPQWQYKLLQQGKMSHIREERIHKLSELGFEWWSLLLRERVDWDERFKELKAFKKEHGYCPVPTRLKAKGSTTNQLALWVAKQRAQYKLLQQGKKSHITDDKRIQKLNAIGFKWSLYKIKP